MLRIDRSPAGVVVVSRLVRGPALVVPCVALAACAVAAARLLPGARGLPAGLALAAILVALLGGRSTRARFASGRVSVRAALPFTSVERGTAEFGLARIETVAEERRRKAERLARAYAERSGSEMPSWLRRDTPGTNDHLRRIVLVARGDAEPLAVTAWLGDEELEPVRATVEALLG
jgi:hypothetical protein